MWGPERLESIRAEITRSTWAGRTDALDHWPAGLMLIADSTKVPAPRGPLDPIGFQKRLPDQADLALEGWDTPSVGASLAQLGAENTFFDSAFTRKYTRTISIPISATAPRRSSAATA